MKTKDDLVAVIRLRFLDLRQAAVLACDGVPISYGCAK